MTDDAGMNADTTTFESTDTQTPPPPRRLVRPVEGRAIAGVAAGLAHYLNMSVGLVRFAFLFAVVFGGLGFVLYGAGWLLIRDEAESESIAQRTFDHLGTGPSWIGIALLVLAGVIILDNITFLPGSMIWALVLVAVGLLLYRGDLGPRTETEPATSAPGTPPAPPETPPATEEGPGDAPPAPPSGSRPSAPPPPPAGPPTPPPPPSILGRLTMGAGLLALGVLAVIDNLTDVIDPQPRHYLALATVVLGLGLLTGAFVGRARWMILLGIFLVPTLLISPATEMEWELERVVAPSELDSLQSSYRSSAGSYVFDLSESDWDGDNVSLDVDLAAGEIVIVLPEDVGLTGSARVGIGAIEAPDGDRGGLGDVSRSFDITGNQGTLDIELDVGVGAIEIYQGSEPGTSGESWDMRFGPGYVSVIERNR